VLDSISSNRPDSFVISTSDIEPVYTGETNVIASCGAIPNIHLNGKELLKIENDWELRTYDAGVWVLNSVQSIITLVLGYKDLKSSGIHFVIMFFDNQIGMRDTIVYNK